MLATPLTDSYVVFDSDLGWMCAVWHGPRLRELQFGHPSPHAAVQSLRHENAESTEPNGVMKKLIRRLQRFCQRPTDDFADVSLDLDGYTAFQSQVVAECRRVPIGETVSYLELAQRVGHPRAARAVGTVMSSNRFPLIVPCHRVVGSGGSLGGYSAPEGLDMKRRLLALERGQWSHEVAQRVVSRPLKTTS